MLHFHLVSDIMEPGHSDPEKNTVYIHYDSELPVRACSASCFAILRIARIRLIILANHRVE